MVDVVEGPFEIGIEDMFLLLLDRIEDGFDSIMTGTSWLEPVGIGFKSGFPFWLEGEFGEMLPCPFFHDGNAQGTLLSLSRLWYPDPAYRRGCVFPVLWVNVVSHDKTFCWSHGFYPVNARSFLALVVLSDPSNRQKPG